MPAEELPADFRAEFAAGYTGRGSIRDGLDTLALLAEVRGQPLPLVWPETLVVDTPSGGAHIWYLAPPGTRWRRGVGLLGWQIDVQAGQCVQPLPGTRTRKGVYAPCGACRNPCLLPDWLAAELERAGLREDNKPAAVRRPRPVVPAGAGVDGLEYRRLEGYLRAVADTIAGAREGQRNDTIFRQSFAVGGLASGSGWLSPEDAQEVLLAAAYACGIDEREALTTIGRGLREGAGRPWTLTDRPGRRHG